MTKLIPLGDNVLVRPATKEKASASGILLVHRKDQSRNEGEVVAVGSANADVRAGDRVIFEEERARSLDFDGERLLRLRAEDLMAVVQR